MKHFYATWIFLLLIFLSAFCKPSIAQNFHLVKDIETSTDSYPSNWNYSITNFSKTRGFAVLNSISYFGADDGLNGRGLWRTDGSSAGTYQVKAGTNPDNIIVANGKLFFTGSGPVGLWMSDG